MSAAPKANVAAYSVSVEMPQARASIAFSSDPRMRSPIDVRVRNSQLPAITNAVITMIRVRQMENSMPPSVNDPGHGSGTER